MESDFLGDSFYIKEEGGYKADSALFIIGVVRIMYPDRNFESFCGKSVFLDKVIVNAGNVSATINKGAGVDGFHRM